MKEHEKPQAITSVFSLITFLVKSQSNCTNKKLVYVIPGLSERPQPKRSMVYTVCSSARRSAVNDHSYPEEPVIVSWINNIGLPDPLFV